MANLYHVMYAVVQIIYHWEEGKLFLKHLFSYLDDKGGTTIIIIYSPSGEEGENRTFVCFLLMNHDCCWSPLVLNSSAFKASNSSRDMHIRSYQGDTSEQQHK